MKYDEMEFKKFHTKSELDKSLHELEGYLKGISIDSEINDFEIKGLRKWLDNHKSLKLKHPYSEIIPVIENALLDNIISTDEVEDIFWICSKFKTGNIFFDVVTSDIQRLHGIILGIMSDGKITTSEIQNLSNWLDDNEHLASCYPYDEINALVTSFLKDGKIDENEEKMFKVLFSDFVDTSSATGISQFEIEQLRKEISIGGICAIDPKIEFINNSFCFTGKSSRTNRDEIEKVILENSGKYTNNVKKDLNYLIVGNGGNPCWAYSCYGRKIEQAIDLRKSGNNIVVVHENDFWDKLEN